MRRWRPMVRMRARRVASSNACAASAVPGALCAARAGFAPVMLQPVNFEALYMQRLQQQEEAAAKEAATTEASGDNTIQ